MGSKNDDAIPHIRPNGGSLCFNCIGDVADHLIHDVHLCDMSSLISNDGWDDTKCA